MMQDWIKKGSVIIPKQKFTILNFESAGYLARVAVFAALVLPLVSSAQTVGTGSIAGIVTDPQGKVIAGAKVEITNKATAATIHQTTNSEGLYSSGPIQPGRYAVHVDAKGFNAAHFPLAVRVGNTTTGDVAMQVGPEHPQVAVPGGTAVNVKQATVQGVLKGEQVEELPINGRSFLDLAQREPGVQSQAGGVLDAGKNGISSISLLTQFGRGTRVAVDGLDISDETVGATTQNIPASAIQEFQVSQSLLDLSTGLTSAGAVNVITRSGSGQLHGELFGVFGGDQGAASLPGSPNSSFQRELFGGNAGGAIVKDKVFGFSDAERAMQNLTAAEPFAFPFNGLNAVLSEPYREFNTDERVDWNMRGSTRAFYRFNFFQDSDVRPYSAATSTQQFRNTNNTLTNALGVDFNTGVYAHSMRFEYLKLRSAVSDATSAVSGVDNPIPGLGINIGASTAGNCILSNGGNYCGGPSWLAPQQNIQSDKLAKYDGSRVWGKHIFRYGIKFNRIDGARLAAFSTFPQVGTTSLAGSSSDPTSYPSNYVSLGNGVGFSTSQAAFGLPAGGFSPDNRVEVYAGDAWKSNPKFTLTYGVSYVHDTGRTDSNLGPLPALDQWVPGLGNRVRNPNLNFAPQAGFAWDLGGDGKTVLRGGGGLIYANSLWNNVEFDSSARLQKGTFTEAPGVCSGGLAVPFAWPVRLVPGSSLAGGAATAVNATTALPTFCGGTISTVAPQILALSSAYQAATASVTGQQPNGAFVGTALTALNPSHVLLYPNYRTPRSWQASLGLEKEIRPGTVLSVDYVRNIGEHFLIGQDVNHSGAARSFNQANAIAARDLAQTANGCPTGFGQVTCMLNSTVATGKPLGMAGAQAAYSAAGLDSNLQTTGGGPCSFCAFPGTNPISGNKGEVGGVDMLFPDGRSLYSGVQAKVVQRIDKPVRGVKDADFQFSYTYSTFTSQVADQDFINLATDNDNPTAFKGPNGLDRKHQISFGGSFDFPWYTRISMIAHFYSPLSQSLELPELTNGGEIFATDWLGAGLGAAAAPEPVPGTKIGQLQRGTNVDTLQNVINSYNHTYAGTLTPAGACLVANSVSNNPFSCPGQISGPPVLTQSDMIGLGWVMPQIGSVARGVVGMPWLRSMDLKASWPIKIKERVTIEPSASVFNALNFWSAYLPGNLPSASLIPSNSACVSNGNCGSTPLAGNAIGGVTPGWNLASFRAGFQSGTYALGAPRRFEFGLRISF